MAATHKCEAAVYDRWVARQFPCGRGANYQEDGKWYCKTHLPSNVRARKDATELRWKAERAYSTAVRDLDHRRRQLCKAAKLHPGAFLGDHVARLVDAEQAVAKTRKKAKG